MNYNINQPAIFTAQTYDTKTTVEIDHSDLDINEVMNAFQTLIVGMGFSNDALKNWVLEKAEEYREDEGPEYDGAGFRHEDNFGGHVELEHSNSHWNHYVSNEEADEDANLNKRERGSITQALLNYVDYMGAATYGELHNYYKGITGSNSFSHVLKSLTTPYKNRPTQRYLAKEGKRYSDAKYVIKIANPSNWVVVDDYDDDFKTFNEAPYGDN